MPELWLFGLLLLGVAAAVAATMLRPGRYEEIASTIQHAAGSIGARFGWSRGAALVAAGEPAPKDIGRRPVSFAEARDARDVPDASGDSVRVEAEVEPVRSNPAQPEAVHDEADASDPPWARLIATVTAWLRAPLGAIGARDVGSAPGRSRRVGIRGQGAPSADESPVWEPDQAAARRILRGDRLALEAVVAALAGDEPRMAIHWQELLDRLFDIILEQALEAGYVDPPRHFPFWGAFTVEQGRDIMKALGSLGFRADGRGAWLDERVPTRRDLSLAVGYAGVDPVRVRTWPTPEELAALGGHVVVAGADYLDIVAPGLSRAEVSAVAESADGGHGLDDLWQEWDRVRSLLLAVE